MKTALITGITGQDGTYLAELLSSKGYRVVGTTDALAPGQAPRPGVELFEVDVGDTDAMARVVAAVRPVHVYHLAAQSSVGVSFAEPTKTFRTNTLGTLNVLEAARKLDTMPRVLVAASGEVFGDIGSAPANERTPVRPSNPYSASKAAAIHAALGYRASFGLPVSVAYFYNHESPRRGPHFVTKKIARAACRIARGLERRLDLGDTTVVRDWGWAPEYMDAAVRILGLDAPDDFVIASGKSMSLDAFVNVAFARVGLDAKEHVGHDPSLVRRVDIPEMHADASHAAERLGWRATIFGAEVVERLVDHERAVLDAELSR